MTPDRIRAIRAARGWSQSDLARYMRIARQATVSNWETGKVAPDGPALVLLEMLEREAVEPTPEARRGFLFRRRRR